MAPKASGRRQSSHPGVTEQHGFKVLRITADIHLLEVIVPTRRDDLPLKFALKLDVRHTIDAKEIIRSTTIGFGRVHAIGNDIDTGGFQTFDRFDYFLREIGSLAFRAFGPGGTVVIELDKDLLHDANLLDAKREYSSLARTDAAPVASATRYSGRECWRNHRLPSHGQPRI